MNPATTNKRHTRKKNDLPIGRKTKKKEWFIDYQTTARNGHRKKATTGPLTHNIVTLRGARNIA
jgi:hypothetical protein